MATETAGHGHTMTDQKLVNRKLKKKRNLITKEELLQLAKEEEEEEKKSSWISSTVHAFFPPALAAHRTARLAGAGPIVVNIWLFSPGPRTHLPAGCAPPCPAPRRCAPSPRAPPQHNEGGGRHAHTLASSLTRHSLAPVPAAPAACVQYRTSCG